MAERFAIARMGALGNGVVDTPTGALHIPFALPGETVLAEDVGGRFVLEAVEVSSPDRIEPFCRYFGRCGGCATQHVGPDLYAGWKRAKVVVALERAGIPAAVEPLVDAHGDGRRRVTFHARVDEGAVAVGFMEARSHRLVVVEACPVTVQALAAAPAVAAQLAAILARIRKPLDVAVTATMAGLDVDIRGSGPLGEGLRQTLIRQAAILDLARLSLHGDVLIERRPPAIMMGRSTFVPPPGAFLQATAAGEAALADAVVQAIGPAKRVADLFAGTGPFALRLAERASVHAVDGDKAMLAALDRAARATPGLRPVTVEARDLFRRPMLPLDLERFDAVVLDPPRAGAEAQVGRLIPSSLDTVVMVSCDPVTFARDAATLIAGGFALDSVLPVDQFKWSAHVEMVGAFRRPKSRRRR